jgi:UDP-3-O-[3-hydroxymyristoyl] N-acetylglucosamine deacetylase
VEGDAALIPADYRNVVDTSMRTTIGNEHGTTVSTIEHLMAALMGCGVDNAIVEVDGPEVPIMDGSAAPFVFLIECAGLEPLQAPRRSIEVLKPVEVRSGLSSARLIPADSFFVSFEIVYDSPVVQRQRCALQPLNGTFKEEVCRARTYGFMNEYEELRSKGLARGASLKNAVVVDDDQILNEGGLRYEDEFVRHKILDTMGDLYLAGAPLQAHFEGVRSGHGLNNQLLHALFDDPDAWRANGVAADGESPQKVPTALAPA